MNRKEGEQYIGLDIWPIVDGRPIMGLCVRVQIHWPSLLHLLCFAMSSFIPKENTMAIGEVLQRKRERGGWLLNRLFAIWVPFASSIENVFGWAFQSPVSLFSLRSFFFSFNLERHLSIANCYDTNIYYFSSLPPFRLSTLDLDTTAPTELPT